MRNLDVRNFDVILPFTRVLRDDYGYCPKNRIGNHNFFIISNE